VIKLDKRDIGAVADARFSRSKIRLLWLFLGLVVAFLLLTTFLPEDFVWTAWLPIVGMVVVLFLLLVGQVRFRRKFISEWEKKNNE
jgi:cell division protein FtsW (lipid II flippase)